eukprot:TRINITY_DN27326_c0_g1_i1.p1 TRINITY_DN27326_c0_g1~~TRINITY_DN27326_c0_g1_i1.p1  ORF type:complete len:719 (-),score=53.23 TRINITY_DN27326_c0_g1_i1:1479-3635(-)
MRTLSATYQADGHEYRQTRLNDKNLSYQDRKNIWVKIAMESECAEVVTKILTEHRVRKSLIHDEDDVELVNSDDDMDEEEWKQHMKEEIFGRAYDAVGQNVPADQLKHVAIMRREQAGLLTKIIYSILTLGLYLICRPKDEMDVWVQTKQGRIYMMGVDRHRFDFFKTWAIIFGYCRFIVLLGFVWILPEILAAIYCAYEVMMQIQEEDRNQIWAAFWKTVEMDIYRKSIFMAIALIGTALYVLSYWPRDQHKQSQKGFSTDSVCAAQYTLVGRKNTLLSFFCCTRMHFKLLAKIHIGKYPSEQVCNKIDSESADQDLSFEGDAVRSVPITSVMESANDRVGGNTSEEKDDGSKDNASCLHPKIISLAFLLLLILTMVDVLWGAADKVDHAWKLMMNAERVKKMRSVCQNAHSEEQCENTTQMYDKLRRAANYECNKKDFELECNDTWVKDRMGDPQVRANYYLAHAEEYRLQRVMKTHVFWTKNTSNPFENLYNDVRCRLADSQTFPCCLGCLSAWLGLHKDESWFTDMIKGALKYVQDILNFLIVGGVLTMGSRQHRNDSFFAVLDLKGKGSEKFDLYQVLAVDFLSSIMSPKDSGKHSAPYTASCVDTSDEDSEFYATAGCLGYAAENFNKAAASSSWRSYITAGGRLLKRQACFDPCNRLQDEGVTVPMSCLRLQKNEHEVGRWSELARMKTADFLRPLGQSFLISLVLILVSG